MTHESDTLNHDSTDLSWAERNVNWIIIGLVVACILTVVAQMLSGPVFDMPLFDEHHPAHFEIENLLGFQAMFGFAAFVVVVFLGRGLRMIVMRKEDYYDS